MSTPPDRGWGHSRLRAPVAREAAGRPEPAPARRRRPPVTPGGVGPLSFDQLFDAIVAGDVRVPDAAPSPDEAVPATDEPPPVAPPSPAIALAVEERLHRLEALVSMPPVEAHVRELRHDLASADRRLAAMEMRLASLETFPASVEELVARHVDRMAGEILSLPAGIESANRELDSVAEAMAGRPAAVSQRLERIEALDAALGELRGRVAEFIDELDHAGGAGGAQPPAPTGDAEPVASSQARVGAPDSEPPGSGRGMLGALTSELERIRHSIDALVLDCEAVSQANKGATV